MRIPFVTLVLIPLVAGCLEERRDDPADSGDLTGDASLPPDGGESTADSGDAGVADTGPTGLPIGEACVVDDECASRSCAIPCEGPGVCAPSACQEDSDCVVPDAETTHCCLNNRCAAIQGAACGDRSGRQGALCGGGGATDCADGFDCLDACVASSYCAASCTTSSECAAIDPALGCFHTVGGSQRCVVDPNQLVACVTDRDCPTDTVCTAGISFTGDGVIKTCMAPAGARVTGAACTNSANCRSGLCLDGFCSAGCSNDADCACSTTACRRDQACLDVWFEVAGSASAAKLCAPEQRCNSTSDCPTTDLCQAYPERATWATTCGRPNAAAGAIGAACAEHGECQTRACYESACRALCTTTATTACAGNETCANVAMAGGPADTAELHLCLP
ncbi:MAG: hypothetical protein HYV07_24775 [Deltaproteobacteria bacterium]|nr:hypothetical protein [Deltaproteobacteria bacterium]